MDGIPERIFGKKLVLNLISSRQKSMQTYQACKDLKDVLFIFIENDRSDKTRTTILLNPDISHLKNGVDLDQLAP